MFIEKYIIKNILMANFIKQRFIYCSYLKPFPFYVQVLLAFF